MQTSLCNQISNSLKSSNFYSIAEQMGRDNYFSVLISYYCRRTKKKRIRCNKNRITWHGCSCVLKSLRRSTCGSSGIVSPGLLCRAMVWAQARPNTTRSSRELAPSLLAPWTDAHAASPAAYRPSTSTSRLPSKVIT